MWRQSLLQIHAVASREAVSGSASLAFRRAVTVRCLSSSSCVKADRGQGNRPPKNRNQGQGQNRRHQNKSAFGSVLGTTGKDSEPASSGPGRRGAKSEGDLPATPVGSFEGVPGLPYYTGPGLPRPKLPETHGIQPDGKSTIISLDGYTEDDYDDLSEYWNMHRLAAPDFLHLTLPKIREAIESFRPYTTSWVDPPSDHILTFETKNYFAVGDRDAVFPGSRKVVVKMNVNDVGLSNHEKNILAVLTKHRFNRKNGVLRMASQRYPTRVLNKEYLRALLHSVLLETKFQALRFNPDLTYNTEFTQPPIEVDTGL